MPVIRPPWLPNGLYQIWLDHYIAAGGEAGGQDAEVTAIELTRQDASYETYFPGIKREDGTIRYPDNPEQTYYTNVESFKNTVEGVGMPNTDIFADDFISLIEGDVSPNEFSSRVTALEDRVMSQGPAIRDFYAENYGLNMTKQGILAGLMSERINEAVLNRQMTMAEIGGEGISRGFDISAEFANMLASEGKMDRNQAMGMFGSAERLMPVLSGLAARHADPDSDFDITEFADATVLDDPEQLARLERLKAQEAAQFTGGAQLGFERGRAGQLTGLAER